MNSQLLTMMNYKPQYENNLQLRSLGTKNSITKPEIDEMAKRVNSKVYRGMNVLTDSWQHSEWLIKTQIKTHFLL